MDLQSYHYPGWSEKGEGRWRGRGEVGEREGRGRGEGGEREGRGRGRGGNHSDVRECVGGMGEWCNAV